MLARSIRMLSEVFRARVWQQGTKIPRVELCPQPIMERSCESQRSFSEARSYASGPPDRIAVASTLVGTSNEERKSVL